MREMIIEQILEILPSNPVMYGGWRWKNVLLQFNSFKEVTPVPVVKKFVLTAENLNELSDESLLAFQMLIIIRAFAQG